MEAFFIVGPTAVGKSAVAIEIARSSGMEIVSADSMLVYKGMDIGTAKPTFAERDSVPHWCIDIASPCREFSVADFRQCALAALRDIEARRRKAIVVGGTGLYARCLTHGLDPLPGADRHLRAQLETVLRENGVEALQDMLAKTAPDRLAALPDKRNPRRLIRAIELAAAGADAPSSWNRRQSPAALTGLRMERSLLNARIRARVEAMYARGLLEEVDGLNRHGLLSATAAAAIGYAEAMDVIAGRLSKADAVAKTEARTRQLAKRQMTWFNRQAAVDWIDVGEGSATGEIAAAVQESWRRNGATGIVE